MCHSTEFIPHCYLTVPIGNICVATTVCLFSLITILSKLIYGGVTQYVHSSSTVRPVYYSDPAFILLRRAFVLLLYSLLHMHQVSFLHFFGRLSRWLARWLLHGRGKCCTTAESYHKSNGIIFESANPPAHITVSLSLFSWYIVPFIDGHAFRVASKVALR